MASHVAKPPVSHVTAISTDDPSSLSTVHASVQEEKLDPMTVGTNISDLDGTKEGATMDSMKGNAIRTMMCSTSGTKEGATTNTAKGTKEGMSAFLEHKKQLWKSSKHLWPTTNHARTHFCLHSASPLTPLRMWMSPGL